MKKVLSTLALAGFAGASLALAADGFSINGKVAYESEAISLGKEHADANIQTTIFGEYQLPFVGAASSTIYAGGTLMSPISSAANGSLVYAGTKLALEEYTFDLGYNYYGYPNSGNTNTPGIPGGSAGFGSAAANNRPVYSDSNEIYVGATYSGLTYGEGATVFTPSLYFKYNFDLQQLTTEVAIRRSLSSSDLGIGLDGFKLVFAGYAGYVQADAYNGDQRATGVSKWKNDYGYIGGSTDLAYDVSTNSTVGLGLRYAHNNDGTGSGDARLTGNTSDNFYYGVWAQFAF